MRTPLRREPQSCDACGRQLEPRQERFCTNMCRETFLAVYGGGTTPSYVFDADEDALEPAERDELNAVAADTNATESDEDDFDDLDDLDDDSDEDDDLDDEMEKDEEERSWDKEWGAVDEEEDDEDDDLDDDDLDDDMEDDEAADPAQPSSGGAVDLSVPTALRPDAVHPRRPTPGAASTDVVPWESVPDMEVHVGVKVVRATCRHRRRHDGTIHIDITAEIGRLPGVPRAGVDRYLRLTAVAEDEAGEFLGWAMTNIPTWEEIPPLAIEHFDVSASAPPARFRLFPEIN